jgi:hypothetical protein
LLTDFFAFIDQDLRGNGWHECTGWKINAIIERSLNGI